jgi:hypothetical protein
MLKLHFDTQQNKEANMLDIINKNQTMSSIQLSEMLGYEKKEINKKVRSMFGDEKAREKFSPTLDSRGRVDFYNLPELESKMIVAKHDIEYLEKITQYWIDRKSTAQPSWLMSLSQEAQIAISDLAMQRDNAIATKAHINDKRTATLMNKASQDSKKIKKLESQLQNVGDHVSLMAAKLPQKIDTEYKSNVQTWRVLKQISDALEHGIIKVKDDRYGEVNTYHIDVIEAFKEEYM